MDRNAAAAELPAAYATALQLRDAGLGDEAIAARIGIEREGVAPLLRIAAAKLDGIVAAASRAPDRDHDGLTPRDVDAA